ncbi:MAG TPA: RNA-binding protein, partial [Hanamia sp.]|nr:RNA-binding protein [Hanamia sp.]
RHDAFNGLCLKGDGKGNFSSTTIARSGFFVKGDAKALAKVHTAKNEDIFIATQNQDSLMVYSKNDSHKKNILKWISLKPDDFCAEVILKDGDKKRIEFYYGDTFLSQSSRKFAIEKNMREVSITNFKGIKRKVL